MCQDTDRQKQEGTCGYFTRKHLQANALHAGHLAFPSGQASLQRPPCHLSLSAAGTSVFPRRHQFLLVPSLVRLPRQRCAFNKLPAPDLARGTAFQKPGVTSCLLGLSDMPEARLVDNVHRYEPLWGPKGFLLCYNGCTVLLTSKYEPNVWFMNKLAFR